MASVGQEPARLFFAAKSLGRVRAMGQTKPRSQPLQHARYGFVISHIAGPRFLIQRIPFSIHNRSEGDPLAVRPVIFGEIPPVRQERTLVRDVVSGEFRSAHCGVRSCRQTRTSSRLPVTR